MNIIFLDTNFTNSDWLNFWGNIIGSALGVVGAFLVMFWQLKKEREKNSKEKIDNTFFNLLTLFQNVKEDLDTDKFIKAIGRETIRHKHNERDKYFTDKFSKEKEQFIQDIKSFNKQTNKRYDGMCNEILYMIENGKDQNYVFELKFYSKLIEKKHFEIFNEKVKNIIEYSNSYRDTNSEFPYELNESGIIEIVKKVFIEFEGDSGNYFRTLYRCLKYIMVAELTMDEKKFYSGVLRGILSPDEMLIVFYNCIYFEKGEKFKELLEKSEKGKRLDFFGDKKDLESLEENNDLPFFSKRKLLFKEYDMKHLKELINGTPVKVN
ncbi:putative phage abortive infection protein [Lactococcus petauri]|uniref:putative phage abortive infection protein n=1 Tax=Lactococcus TaxID=1357 RepID=UPI0038530318